MSLDHLSTAQLEHVRGSEVDMERCALHHVEFNVKDGLQMVRRFTSQFGFSTVSSRTTADAEQWLVRTGQIRCLITQTKRCAQDDERSACGMNCYDGIIQKNLLHSVRPHQPLDTVCDVALEVKEIDACLRRLAGQGVEVTKPLQCLREADDASGCVWTATVKSCVGNVVHTLVQKDGFCGDFLPGFKVAKRQSGEESQSDETDDEIALTHVDHITFACPTGSSSEILQWYEECFGMKRFVINSEDDEEQGFVIDTGDVGLRLKAFEYWKCAETGLQVDAEDTSLKFVVAEALPNQGPNQVGVFLTNHGGPGIQHIGFHTSNILATVQSLKKNGILFSEPPQTYYTEVGRLGEMQAVGLDVQALQEHGILIDTEPDVPSKATEQHGHSDQSLRYLMQKFTQPLFEEDTFFLEIIQRAGATGFGAGNITALWRSVQAYLSQRQNRTPGDKEQSC